MSVDRGMGSLKDDLLSPSAYPGASEAEIELIETHISLVFLREAEVLKVKKPFDLGFLDFRTIEQRREACEAELRLNRRLAPDIYLEVVPVRRRADGLHHFGPEGEIVDWAVRMRRLSEKRRADLLLARGELDGSSIDRIAETVARFHETTQTDARIASFGLPEVVGHSVRENFEQTRKVVHRYLDKEQADELEHWQLESLSRLSAKFRARATAGKVRDGHGDLRLEHIYLRDDGALTVIDCIEFNERFRYADVAADLAFLAMDLAWHGRVDLGERLLASYARETGDYDLYELASFYESYRAYVRAKVSTFLAEDEGASPATRLRAAKEARRYFLLSYAAMRKPILEPVLIAVGGVIASGKSTVSAKIGEALSAPVIDADRTRKQLLGIAPTQAVDEAIWQGAYAPDFTERVYAEVLRRAEVVLRSGRPVVLDASFRSASLRSRARELAKAKGLPFLFVECRAPREACRERLVRRERERGVSDGRLAIFDDFCAKWEEVNELEASQHLVLDTSRSLEESLQGIEERITFWPRGFVS